MGKRKKVTTRDIAEYAGISQSTVSMILSEKKNVSFSPETIKAVKEAARVLGYKKPEKKAPAAADILKNTIIVFAPSLANGYFSTLIHSITEHARRYDYRVMTAVTFRKGEYEHSFLDQYKDDVPAGIILLYPPDQRALVNTLARKIPIVAIGEKPSGGRYDSVELDGHKTGYMMGEYLLSRGHKQVCYVSPPVNEKNAGRIRRYQGMADAFKDHGREGSTCLTLAASKPLAYSRYSPDEAEYRNGYDLTRQILTEGTKQFVTNSFPESMSAPEAGMPNPAGASPGSQAASPNTLAASPGSQAASPGPLAASPGSQAASPDTLAASPGSQAASPGSQAASPNTLAASPNTPAASPARQPDTVTAFAGHNDMTALGIMAAIRDLGYKIPQDYSVAGFDNIVLSGMPQINLTTIEHSSVQKGREAVELIHRKHSLNTAPKDKKNYILRMEYEPELIIRGTVRDHRKTRG